MLTERYPTKREPPPRAPQLLTADVDIKKNPHLEKSGGGLVVLTTKMPSKANPLYGFIGTSGFLWLAEFALIFCIALIF